MESRAKNLVVGAGLEPATSSMSRKRATNCANRPHTHAHETWFEEVNGLRLRRQVARIKPFTLKVLAAPFPIRGPKSQQLFANPSGHQVA